MVCNVIKVGGAVVEDEGMRALFLERFSSVEGMKVLVHGGGRSATAVAGSLGIETRMIHGRRVTDEGMRKVVAMVYGGLVNKEIVASLQTSLIDAVGLTGADLKIVVSRRRSPVEIDGETVDFGYVGDVVSVNSSALRQLMEWGKVPVIAPLSFDPAHGLMNTNADTMASEIAASLSEFFETTLTFCFEKEGVLDPERKVIPFIDKGLYEELKSSGTVSGGMIPKIDNAFAALRRGVKTVRITDTGHLNGGTVIYG